MNSEDFLLRTVSAVLSVLISTIRKQLDSSISQSDSEHSSIGLSWIEQRKSRLPSARTQVQVRVHRAAASRREMGPTQSSSGAEQSAHLLQTAANNKRSRSEDWDFVIVISDEEPETLPRPKKRLRSASAKNEEQASAQDAAGAYTSTNLQWYLEKHGSFKEAGLFRPSPPPESDDDQPDLYAGRQRPDGRYSTGGKAILDPTTVAQNVGVSEGDGDRNNTALAVWRGTSERRKTRQAIVDDHGDHDMDTGKRGRGRQKQPKDRKKRSVNRVAPTVPNDVVYQDGPGPISQEVLDMVDRIKKLTRKPGMGYPMRMRMREMGGPFDKRLGFLLDKSILTPFFGDTRLFTEKWWKFLRTCGDGTALGKSDEPPVNPGGNVAGIEQATKKNNEDNMDDDEAGDEQSRLDDIEQKDEDTVGLAGDEAGSVENSDSEKGEEVYGDDDDPVGDDEEGTATKGYESGEENSSGEKTE